MNQNINNELVVKSSPRKRDKEYLHAYYIAHKEVARAKKLERYKANPELYKIEALKRWNKRNKDLPKSREIERAYRLVNSEKLKEYDSRRRNTPEYKAVRSAHYQANKESLSKINKQWREENKDRRKAYLDAYYSRPDVIASVKEKGKRNYIASREAILLANAKWREENKGRRAEYMNAYRTKNKKVIYAKHAEYRRSNPQAKMTAYLRSRVSHAIKKLGGVKSARTEALIGCSFKHLMAHLESLFKPGMTWENYGKWEIDHIKPCAIFDLTAPNQQRACFHFTNVQPLWRDENRSKYCRYDPDMEKPV